MRLIDAEALEWIIRNETWLHYQHSDVILISLDDVIEGINEMPTIEAKPVVHAHWEKGCDDEYIAIPWWTCSHCGKGALTKKETIYDQVLTDYCPYCGAQMDELVSNTDKLNSSVKIPVLSMEDVPKIMEE